MKYYSSRIYASLLIALLMGCQSNVNLPKQPPDKVAEEEQVIRAYTAATVNNKPTTQENTDTKEIVREREQADDTSPISLQDSTTMPIDATNSLVQDGEVATDEEAFDTKIEQELNTSMLNATPLEQSYNSDDGDIAQEWAALTASTEEAKNDIDQLGQNVVHEIYAAILKIPGSMQE